MVVCSTLLALAAGCGDDDNGATRYEVSCDRACDRVHECDSTMDIEDCAMTCKEDTAPVGPNLRADFLAGIDACVAELSCVQLAAAAVLQPCQREAAARLAPSASAEALCQAVVESIQECAGISVGTAGCLEGVKIFNDAALTSARACAEEPCDQRTACLSAELGMDPSAPGPLR